MADPGFPFGGIRAVGRDADLRRGHFLAKTCVKESDPIGRAHQQRPLDPPMSIDSDIFFENEDNVLQTPPDSNPDRQVILRFSVFGYAYSTINTLALETV